MVFTISNKFKNKNNMADKNKKTQREVVEKQALLENSAENVQSNDSKETNSSDMVKKTGWFKKIFIVLLIIGLGFALFWLGKNWQNVSNIINFQDSGVSYSENQQRVIDNFGLPQTFTIAQQDGQKLESWKYIYLDEIFVFQDGEFVARQHFNFDLNTDEGLYLDYQPQDFYQLQSLKEISELLAREPSFEAQIDPEIMGEDNYFYSFDHFLNVSVVNDEVVGIQTVAFKTSKEANDISVNTEEKTTTQEPGSKPGKDYVANTSDKENSFSYYLDDPVYRLIKQRRLESIDGSESEVLSYAYCYSLDQGASLNTEPQDPWACADEESMVWIIELIPVNTYAQLDEIELIGKEELMRNSKYVYAITHLNGDLPEGLPTWPEILQDVKDDFSVPMADEYANFLNL